MRQSTERYSTQRYEGDMETATRLAEAPPFTNGVAKPVEKTLIAQMDAKTTTPVKMSAGLASLIGIGIALVSGLLGWAMSYQSVVSRVGDVEKRLEKMDTAIESLQSLKVTTVTMSNTIETIKKNQEENARDRKEDSKNIADIRILLAQKGMQ